MVTCVGYDVVTCVGYNVATCVGYDVESVLENVLENASLLHILISAMAFIIWGK